MKKYKGFSILVKWMNADFGFRTFVFDSEMFIIHKSEAFFYDYNALAYGMEYVDRLVEQAALPGRLHLENTNNWRRMHGIPMKRKRGIPS